jgi:hypothetical protein
MTRVSFDPIEARGVLARTPAVLRALLSGLPVAWLNTKESAAAWTPLQVLGHLVEAEQVLWIPRARSILEHGADAVFPEFDRDAHLVVHDGRDADDLLALFEERREGSLAQFDAFGPLVDSLDLEGRHPAFGSVTLGQLLSTWVVHDLAHSRQIFRAMAKHYRDAVGPWRQYLSVLEE